MPFTIPKSLIENIHRYLSESEKHHPNQLLPSDEESELKTINTELNTILTFISREEIHAQITNVAELSSLLTDAGYQAAPVDPRIGTYLPSNPHFLEELITTEFAMFEKKIGALLRIISSDTPVGVAQTSSDTSADVAQTSSDTSAGVAQTSSPLHPPFETVFLHMEGIDDDPMVVNIAPPQKTATPSTTLQSLAPPEKGSPSTFFSPPKPKPMVDATQSRASSNPVPTKREASSSHSKLGTPTRIEGFGGPTEQKVIPGTPSEKQHPPLAPIERSKRAQMLFPDLSISGGPRF